MAGHQSPTQEEFIDSLEENGKHVEDKGNSKLLRLIFTSPFFKIIHEPTNSTRLTVVCYSCGVVRKCGYNNYAHLKRHLKRLHPNLHTLYEKHRWKIACPKKNSPYMNSAKKRAAENELKLISQHQAATFKEDETHVEDKSKSSEFARIGSILNQRQITTFKDDETQVEDKPSEFEQKGSILNQRQVVTFKKDEALVEGKSKSSEFARKRSTLNQCQVATFTKDETHVEEKSKSSEFARKRSILNPPFFKICQELANGTSFTVRCCSCRTQTKCGYQSTVHLKNHLRRFHPNLNTLYEKYRRKSVFNYAKKQKVKRKAIESNQQNQVKSSQLKMTDNVKDIVSNDNDIATTSKNSTFIRSSTTDKGLCEHLENETKSKEKLKTYTGDLRKIIFKLPFYEIINQSADSDKFTVRCCTCGLVKESCPVNRGPLIQHMQTSHPDVYKKYEEYICADDDASANNITSGCNNEIEEQSVTKIDDDSQMEDTLREIDGDNTPNSSKNLRRQYNKTYPHKRTIFKEPFFNVIRVCEEDNNRLLVSCHTCHVVKKSTRYNASHLTDHIKRVHPEIYKIYEERKRENFENFQKLRKARNGENSKESNALNLPGKSFKNVELIIDRTLKKLVNHTGYYAIKNRLTKLTENDAYEKHSSTILQLKSDIENLKKECNALRLDVKQSKVNKIKLHNEIHKLDSLLNQRKLIIINMKLKNKKQPLKEVQNLFKNVLNLGKVKIVNCTLLLKSRGTSDAQSVSVELLRPEDCNLVLNQVAKLKNTGISIEPELTPLLREHRNKLMIIRKELLSRKPDINVLVRNATLIVDGKYFYWDEVEGLCHDFTSSETKEISSVEYLNQLTGLDLSEIIHVLYNYDVKGFEK